MSDEHAFSVSGNDWNVMISIRSDDSLALILLEAEPDCITACYVMISLHRSQSFLFPLFLSSLTLMAVAADNVPTLCCFVSFIKQNNN